MQYWLVMPAAGTGRRFGSAVPKQYAPLSGLTVIEWSLAPFLGDERCLGVVLALAAGDAWFTDVARRLPPGIVTVPGGAERGESVLAGLAALAGRAAASDWVLVHDAARPCLDRVDLDRLLEHAAGHGGGLLAARAADTLKRAVLAGGARGGPDVCAEVDHTVDRTGLWRALTPQMFRHGELLAALRAALDAGRRPTDEAQALEWAGARPLLVEGSAANIKVTSAQDLAVAEALLAARRADAAVGGKVAVAAAGETDR